VLLFEESGGVVVVLGDWESSVESGGQPCPAPAPVVFSEHSGVVREESVVLLPEVELLGLLELVLFCVDESVVASDAARRIVPELCVPVSALVSEPERMLWHPPKPAPTTDDATIAMRYRLFMFHLSLAAA
jgi:hypothetical protein